ncbi:MAG: hypothetical protein ACLR8P_00710 [Clostridium fessum]
MMYEIKNVIDDTRMKRAIVCRRSEEDPDDPIDRTGAHQPADCSVHDPDVRGRDTSVLQQCGR